MSRVKGSEIMTTEYLYKEVIFAFNQLNKDQKIKILNKIKNSLTYPCGQKDCSGYGNCKDCFIFAEKQSNFIYATLTGEVKNKLTNDSIFISTYLL